MAHQPSIISQDVSPSKDRMEKETMMQEMPCKISSIPLSKYLKWQSISATRSWPPGCSHSPPSKIYSHCCQPQPLDVSMIPDLDEEKEEGEITPVEMSFEEEKAGAGVERGEGHTGEPLIAEEHNGKSVLENNVANYLPHHHLSPSKDRMENEIMMEELPGKISSVPLSKNLKQRSISATSSWVPGCDHSPLSKIYSPCSQPLSLGVGMTPELDEEQEDGKITHMEVELSFDEEQNNHSSNKVGAGIEKCECPAGEPLVAEEKSGKCLLENDSVNSQWWMNSKVYPPPKRRAVSANRRYPPGCGRNPDFSVADFDSKRYCKKADGMNAAVLGKNAKVVSDGVGGTNKKSKEIGEAGVMGSVNGAGFRHIKDKYVKNDRLKGETSNLESHAKLVRDSEDRDVSSVMVKGVGRETLEKIAEERDVDGQNVDNKFSSCAKLDRVHVKGVSVDKNSTLDAAQKKGARPTKIKILYKGKKEEAFKASVPSTESPVVRAEERGCSNSPLTIKKSPMKVISKKWVGMKGPVSRFNPSFPNADRCELGDEDLEECASHAIQQSRSCPSQVPFKNSVRAQKSMLQASSSEHNVNQDNIAYFGPKKAVNRPTDPRAKVKRCLRLYQMIYRNLLQEAESGKKPPDMVRNRIDLRTAVIMRENKETLNRGEPIVGTVPGVEVGDEYHYRAELSILGLHRPPQAGIDYVIRDGEHIATSIVASGGYSDEVESEDLLIYTGAGGQPTGKPGHTKPLDQKLERGNLALKTSIDLKNSIRVIHGWNTNNAGKPMMTFTYDGLYNVEQYWSDEEIYVVKGVPMKARVFRFRLRRLKDQPERNWSKLKRMQKSKVREGLCSKDISLSQEKLPICVVNNIDNEIPPQFQYITKTLYPSWYQNSRPKGCNCKGRCSDMETCSCAVKNGGQIPFNFNGAIVRAKPLIYECGPACGCPPSCYNRVSQKGIKFPLEVFKTKERGWGVRSLCSIPSGSFVCEYTGELLWDQEAEQRENDEYLFDIGHNYDDSALWEGLPSDMLGISNGGGPEGVSSSEGGKQEGFTIDAREKGNVGRFINHSCSPNLYAQNVLFDHDDKKMPHIMFFAAENIPPLKELTYHYNYIIGSVQDSDGNVKVKECYCGTSECKGRLY